MVSLFKELANEGSFADYLERFRGINSDYTFSVLSVDGGTNNPSNDNTMLPDAYTQITAGVATKVPMTLIAVGLETNDGPVCTLPI